MQELLAPDVCTWPDGNPQLIGSDVASAPRRRGRVSAGARQARLAEQRRREVKHPNRVRTKGVQSASDVAPRSIRSRAVTSCNDRSVSLR